MKRFTSHRGLRFKLLTANITIVLILGLLIIIFVKTIYSERLLHQFQRNGLHMTERLTEEAIDFILTRDELNLQVLINDHKESIDDIEYIFVLNEKGKVLTHTFKGAFPVDLKRVNILEKDEEFRIEGISIEGRDIYDIAVSVLKGEAGVVHIGFLEEPFLKDTARMVRVIVGIALAALIIAVILTAILGNIITRPILRLTRAVRMIGRGELSSKIQIKGRDEISELAAAFNEMVEDLKKAKQKIEGLVKSLERRVDERTSELKATQERLIRSEKLAVLGKLAGSLSHELRNPLGVIKNAVYYLNMPEAAIDKKTEKEYLNIIRRQIDAADKIIGNTLDFARPRELELQKGKINKAVADILSVIKIPENIKIKKDYKEDVEMLFDLFQIRQAFYNIAMNSIQAMKDGGEIRITTEREGDFVKIIFEDTGEGISRGDLKSIFEPLFSKKAKGVGLGLTIVKDIIERHKGSICAESEVGKTTRVKVKLPIDPGVQT